MNTMTMMNKRTLTAVAATLTLILLLLLAACAQDTPDAATAEPATTAESAAAVETATAAQSGIVQAEGQVVPARAADLSFQTGGTVAEVLVNEGQTVRAGEAIARLDASAVAAGLLQAQAGLEAANAGLSAAEAQLTLAESGRRTAEAGVAVAEAQLALLRAGARPEQVAAAERNLAAAESGVARAAAERDEALSVNDAQVRAAEAQLAGALARLTSLQETYDTIVTTCVELPDGGEVCPLLGPTEENVRAQLAAAEAAYNAAQLAVTEARAGATAAQQQAATAAVGEAVAQRDLAAAQLNLLNAGAREEQIRVAEVAVEQAKLGLAQANVAVQQAQAGVTQATAARQGAEAAAAEAQNALDRMTLVAPFDGVVVQPALEVGELVAPGVIVARLAEGGNWHVETTDLVELDVVNLVEGQAVEVTLDALSGEVLRGRILSIGRTPQIVRGDVTYPARIVLDAYPDLPLRWGMTAQVSVDTR